MDLMLEGLLGLDPLVTDDLPFYNSFEGPKFTYTSQLIDGLAFYKHKIMVERGVRKHELDVFQYEGLPAFFPAPEEAAMPFDIFAASFYLVTRYEEYLPFKKDDHNRFPPEASVAFKHNFMQKPMVNIWSKMLKKRLSAAFPDLKFLEPQYKFTPTYDIDIAWSYQNKGFLRNLGGYARDLKDFKLDNIAKRTSCLLRMQKDPYDTYDYLKELQNKYKLKPIYFFIVGDFDKYDKNIHIGDPAFQHLINEISDYSDIGFHPSYASNYNKRKLVKEKERLEEVLRRPVVKSRQHYLMLEFPRTYQNLIDIEVSDDYTLGYTSQLGFRSGICTPYYFYNLQLEIKSKLRLHTFSVMDATMQYYQKLQPEEVLEKVKPVIDEVKAVGGHMMTLWHNNSFSEENEWKDWRKPYEEILEYAVKKP